MPIFQDREDAGRQLAARLTGFSNRPDVIVLALPRGGVPVAREVADALKAPLDVFLVRKLGVPGHPELAMGAIAAGGIEVLHHDLIDDLGISSLDVEQVSERERRELERRERTFRGVRPFPEIRGWTVIIVDDGLATGATMEAAVLALRRAGPASIVVAVPVGAPESCERLSRLADAVVCITMPPGFRAVGEWYLDFTQTSDDDVRRMLGTD